MDALALLKQDIQQWNQWRARHDYEPYSFANQDLSNGYFFDGDFRGVDLSETVLKGACLIGANLQGVNLRGANLRGAYLDDANLNSADIRDADFSYACLTKADLRNVKIENTLFIETQLAHVQTTEALCEPKGPVKKRTTQHEAQEKDQKKDPEPGAFKLSGNVVSRRLATAFLWLNLAPRASVAVGLVAIFVALPLFSNEPSTQPQSPSITLSSAELDAELTPRSETMGPQLALADSITESSAIWAIETYAGREGEVVIVGTESGQIVARHRKRNHTLYTLDAHADAVRDIAIAANHNRLISSGSDGVKIWHLETGELLQSLPSSSPIWSVAVSPDESRFISSDYHGNITVRRLDTGEALYSIANNAAVWSVAISPDGNSFVSGDSNHLIRQWNLETGQLIKTFTGHLGDVRAVAISPNGRILVSGSWDSTVKLWSLETGELKTTLEGHRDRVVSLAISDNGKTLASGSVDTVIKLWDLSGYNLIDSLEAHSDWVLSAAFTIQEQTLITGGKDKEIKIWQ